MSMIKHLLEMEAEMQVSDILNEQGNDLKKKVDDLIHHAGGSAGGWALHVAIDDGDEKAAEKILRANSNDDEVINAAMDSLFGKVD